MAADGLLPSAESGAEDNAPGLTSIAPELRNNIYECFIEDLLATLPQEVDIETLSALSDYKNITAISCTCRQLRAETKAMMDEAVNKLCMSRDFYFNFRVWDSSDPVQRDILLERTSRIRAWPLRKIEVHTLVFSSEEEDIRRRPMIVSLDQEGKITVHEKGLSGLSAMDRSQGLTILPPQRPAYAAARLRALEIKLTLESMAKLNMLSLTADGGKILDVFSIVKALCCWADDREMLDL